MRDRSRQGVERAHARDMRQLPSRVVQSLLCSLPFSQIDHVRHPLTCGFIEAGNADQDWHAAAIFAKELLLKGLQDAGRLEIRNHLIVTLAPLGRCEIDPAQREYLTILAVISDYSQE